MEEKKKEIFYVPRKLRGKFLLIGFTWVEIFVLAGIFVTIMSFRLYVLAPVIVIYFIFLCRFDGNHNAVYWLKLIWSYYKASPQSYTSSDLKKGV